MNKVIIALFAVLLTASALTVQRQPIAKPVSFLQNHAVVDGVEAGGGPTVADSSVIDDVHTPEADYVQDYGDGECCGPEEPADINVCEVELLENYRTIDVSRTLTVERKDDGINWVNIEIDLNIPHGVSSDVWSVSCQSQFKSSLSIIDSSNEKTLTPHNSYQGTIKVETQTYNHYSTSVKFTDVTSIARREEIIGDTNFQVITFVIYITNLRGEVLRRHIFRSYVSQADELVETQRLTEHVPRTKIYTTDENCQAGASVDGECKSIITPQIEIEVFTGPDYSINFTEGDELIVGDPVYVEVRFVDPSYKKYIKITSVLFNPACCDKSTDTAQSTWLDLFATSDIWIIEAQEGYTRFYFLTMKSFEDAEIKVNGTVVDKAGSQSKTPHHHAPGVI